MFKHYYNSSIVLSVSIILAIISTHSHNISQDFEGTEYHNTSLLHATYINRLFCSDERVIKPISSDLFFPNFYHSRNTE